MKTAAALLATACLLAPMLTPGGDAIAAQRVSSERSTTAPAAPAQLKYRDFPVARTARVEYRELSVRRILQVQQRNAANPLKPTQIGIGRTAANEAGTSGGSRLAWVALADGSRVARLEVTSPVALGVRVGARPIALDPRMQLRFAGSDDPARVVATLTGAQIRALSDRRGVFWTPATDGETQIIEIHAPRGVAHARTALHAPEISHLLANSANDYKIIAKIGESGSCNVDTACRTGELGAPFVSAKNAVAHMQFNLFQTNGAVFGTFICTGTLLADTDGASQIPYFYTAHHCFAGGGDVPVQTSFQAVANTLNTYWKYEATACGSGVQAAKVLLGGGADFLYSDASTDAMLLRLKNAPPAGSEFAGWNSAVLATSASIIGIHHPAGDAKKVSGGQQLGRDASLITVGWLSGTTEGGSSGSAIFTADAGGYALRGGLYGGSASCANAGSLANAANRDYYSRFDVVYPNISQYLAPASSAPIRVNGAQPLVPPSAVSNAASKAPATTGKRLRRQAMRPDARER